MAENIKKIAVFSEDGIQQAIARVFHDDDDKEKFEDKLKELCKILGKKEKKGKKDKTNLLPTSDEIYETAILPQIHRKIQEYEENELQGASIKLSIQFPSDIKSMNVEQMKQFHTRLMKQEQIVQDIDLLLKFHRGYLYLIARSKLPQETNVKDWFHTEFGVVYSTAHKYMCLALLIKRFPRLLVCGLSFNQLVKHYKRILKTAQNKNTNDQLSQSVVIICQDQQIEIKPGEVTIRNSFDQSTDPDIAIISEKKEEDVLDVNLIEFDDKTDETDKDIEDLQMELTKM